MKAITGEVRRIKVVYFLRHGRGTAGWVEQPHLFCAYHSSSNDLLLKDIKRWLVDLRGSQWTEAFSWSYKRRYKMGYIWQDVLDNDFVMPISHHEYVLQGCEKVGLSPSESCSQNDQASSSSKVSPSREEIRDKYPPSLQTESSTSLQQHQLPSSDTSTLNIKSMHIEDDEDHFGMGEPRNHSHSHTSFKFGLPHEKSTEKRENITGGIANTPVSSVCNLSFAQPPLTKSKRHFSGASNKLRNLLTCGAVDTNDAVLVMINRVEKKTSVRQDSGVDRSSQISRIGRLGRSGRTSNNSWTSGKGRQERHYPPRKSFNGVEGWKRSKKQKDACEGDRIVDAYKPISMPNCSQCGKTFKPEKMHKHMKSCKGMRALSRRANN